MKKQDVIFKEKMEIKLKKEKFQVLCTIYKDGFIIILTEVFIYHLFKLGH